MAKGSSPSLPATPTYQEDPRFKQGLDQLFGLGGRLTNFDFSGGLSPLQDTISTSPETTRLFFEGLKAELDPFFRDARQKTINQLAANNQLQSSTTANRLASLESDLQKKYITAGTNFGLADIDRALRNRIQLFGTGLNTINRATGFAEGSEARKNQFNLANYENQVASTLYGRKPERGGLFGALAGGAGGALLGLGAATLAPMTGGFSLAAAAPFIGAGALGGGLLGGFGERGYGRGLLQGSAGIAALPRSTASDDPFSKDIRDYSILDEALFNPGELALSYRGIT